ncbi:UBX domain-containing protein 1/4, partial [Tremellales sp. Uapishka_1]
MSDKEQLAAMGFEPARIEWALKATKNAGLQPAMDHLLGNSEKPVPAAGEQGKKDAEMDEDEDDQEALAAHVKKMGGKEGSENDQEAKSLKCGQVSDPSPVQSDQTTDLIKPLTEEEKKEKLADLRKKLAEKRARQAGEQAKENKANESLRRMAGRDASKIKEDLEVKEALKEAERKKREKIEDAKAKAAIKAQIEQDKRERAEKSARDKAIRDGQAPAPTAASAPLAKPSAAVKSSENPETRLQVRLSTGGAPLTKTFPSESTLVDVAEWVASENLAFDVSTVKFASTFPRKQFSAADMSKTLKENGLTPSAVLMAS